MKMKLINKNRNKKKFKVKFLLFCILFIISIVSTFNFLLKSRIKINDKQLVNLILKDDYYESRLTKIFKKIIKNYEPVKLLNTNYYDLVPKEEKVIKKVSEKKLEPPLIYIYNTHQKEEYAVSNFVESEVRPTVMMASYIMQDVFNKNMLSTIVEERSINEVLTNNNWKYYKSYDASRLYLNDTKNNNSSLKYFIDVHRDSLNRDKTTVEINGKSYAKTIFLIGTENPNYQKNLEFITKVNNKLNEKYPNLSKGIYKKGGEGVNGVYNQDNSEYTLLIEIGGVDNTVLEVLNSTLAFCDVFMEVITTNEG